jgi:hypothetical protein
MYQFDKKLFEPLLKLLDIPYPTNISNEQFIFDTLKLLKMMMEYPFEEKCEYLTRVENCIHFIPIRQKNHRNNMVITF